MLASSVIKRWFDPQSGQTRDYEIGIAEREREREMLYKNVYIYVYRYDIYNPDISRQQCGSSECDVGLYTLKSKKRL